MARSYQNQLESVNKRNHTLIAENNNLKELLGLCESKDPTDKDRAHLKTLVRKLKKRNDSLTSANK
eukprot:CAMPEP_0176403622 /NCGR_PEP_ID=MMETSP0126-20121128/50252_1 /TAXON_ID=141414 ORGANISM="Strombidinopsis acuminatum, Strain SPMC142" /NCGR_SAMPLE_ID=MMETSP0126 /ASSEMBLY_ACC=CAM_ASM_000229 /LENGTH=65 /DNA_ID=CAMNT_0017782003 /DNA_START=745 /DNA_END=942 /DNA_ORIENTATION=-